MLRKRKVIKYHEDSSSEESKKVNLVTIDHDGSDEEEKPAKKKMKQKKTLESDKETTTSSSSDEYSDWIDSDFDPNKPCSSKSMFSRKKTNSSSISSRKKILGQKSTTSSVSADIFSSSDHESSDELSSSRNKNNNSKSVEQLQAEVVSLKKQLQEEKLARSKAEKKVNELTEKLSKVEKISSGPPKSRLTSVYERQKCGSGRKPRHTQLHVQWDPKNPEYLSALSKIKKTVVGGKERWQCPLCERTYKGQKNVKVHVGDNHFNRQYVCPDCPKIFNSHPARHQHIIEFHSGKKNKFTGKIRKELKVLELIPENNEIICRQVLEEKDRDFLCDHWICRYLPNLTSNEPPPHLFASGFTRKIDRMSLKSVVDRAKRACKNVDHSKKNTKDKARNGCESIKKMKNLGFDLDSSTTISCGVISIGKLTAIEVKPAIRDKLYATYSRNHLDSFDLLNEEAALHIHDTLKPYVEEAEAQRTIWNKWAKENIHLLVLEALNTKNNRVIGVTITKIIDHIGRTRLVGATFLEPDIEQYLQKAVHDKSILSVHGHFKIQINKQ